MSFRRYIAAGAGLFAASVLVGVGLTGAQGANSGLPFITGGGHTQNNNSGAANPQTNFGGFNAHATAPGRAGANDSTVYPAKGEVQGKSRDDVTGKSTGRLHGDVVCIANRGPSSSNGGGGNPDNNIWEIRFQIERSTLPGVEGLYGSLFVQDNGSKGDFSDESFDPDELTNPNCGDVTEFQMEPHQGQITVHRG